MLKQGNRKIWVPGVPELDGLVVKVVGIASNGVPVLGMTYIVELLQPIKGYEYTHTAAFECHLH